MTATHPPRRVLLRTLVAGMLALPLVLGACGGDDAGDDGKTELSFFWWGGEARAELTEIDTALAKIGRNGLLLGLDTTGDGRAILAAPSL